MSSRITKTLSVAALTAALAACSSVPLDQAGSGSGSGAGSSTGMVMDPFNPQSPLAQQRSVYFEFDSYVVPEQYRNVVEMHSSYLTANSQQRVRVEGHADARGGSEYNLALGQRRSEAVARMMTLMGVRADQIETISFGKERPKAMGNTEADYAENRRADINYQR
ncbi:MULTISPECIES: peptidoglycan-associated lipoprotein Pal [unclassified Pusillimonas]|jgi:peptidoglycan-associated lipoprotein|uniref:peptidoglycan-associated lipoprotein Pal n=1 Tax=unclassified Pusillimonas TaxID=2640016 RepID=UPI000B9CDFBD|nr:MULTISPECIES: peptidoglycan-associated lipoprotein Pal [unclassified Pusillimonas]OXR49814.1 peptidoglycan-associated lipoprotein [Pusillimonas sp. T2]ROT43971.1 peptidoglycan-associated lipoprotein [Pusillimonas sp. NJUB218]